VINGHYNACRFILSGIREDCGCRNRTDLQLIVITLAIFVGEFVGGIWTGSMALLADSFHILSDNAVLIAIIAASWITSRASKEMTCQIYGCDLHHSFGLQIFHAGIRHGGTA
jgi:Co/Zn/Cd efflux system component